MTDLIKRQIELLPTKSGCYLMYDDKNNIIYIGKAKNLKNRVSQYFLREQIGKTKAMVSHVNRFETIITSSDKEAFILEMNLIQKYHPRYNIILMDDKHYPYIEVHKNIKDPYISIARNLKNKKSLYYGPYPNSRSAFEIINLINSIYPLRKCSNVKKSPCLYYHLNKCLAPCVNKIEEAQYEEIIESINRFLKGDNALIIKEIEKKILEASNELNFELALEYKNKLDAIKYINEKQKVEFLDKIDRDFVAFYISNNFLSLDIFIYRNGLLIGKKNFVYEIIGETNEFISDFILQYYASIPLPSEIYLANEDIYHEIKDSINTKIIYAKQGRFFDVLNLVSINAKENLNEFFHYKSLKKDKEELLIKLGELLKIDTPYKIELFDNSHLQGTNAIGAMVTFINGEEINKLNRIFNIESFNKKDDLSSMKEVIYRRYKRLKENNEIFPDLIILDGGINQIKIAKEALDELNIKINICSLVKNDKHQTREIVNSNLEFIQVNDNDLFLFLTKMQDAIHRYAISTHIQKRNKSMFKSLFDNIKGLGNKRKENLLKHFDSLEELKNASLTELEQYLPKDVANTLFNKLKE